MNPITRKCDYNRGNVGKNILLIIDPQNDFILGNHTPTLGVSNSDKDMERLILMLQKNGKRFDEIHVSLDSHTRNHIGHIGFWKTDKEISEQEKRDKVREPINFNTFYVNKNELNKIYINNLLDGNHAKTKDPKLQSWAYQYILKMQLHEMKLSPPCIWPDHCIISDDKGIQNIETYTKGWEVYEPLRDELDKLKNKVFYHEKGTNDLVEMYSIFSAEIPFEELIENPDIENIEYIKNMYRNKIPVDEILNWHKNTPNINKNYNTEFNEILFDELMGVNNRVFICGEAKSHCVKKTIQDMIHNCYNLNQVRRIYYLVDLTSNIDNPDFIKESNDKFTMMKKCGLNEIYSNNICIYLYEKIGFLRSIYNGCNCLIGNNVEKIYLDQ